MLIALRVNYHDHQSSIKSMTYHKSQGRRHPLHHGQRRSLRSILTSTLRGAKCCSSASKDVLDPSTLTDMTKIHAPRPKTSRGRAQVAHPKTSRGRTQCKTSVSSGNDHPSKTSADSVSSFDSASSKGKGQHRSTFKRLIKLVSPIKGLPGLLSHRKVSKKENKSKKDIQVCMVHEHRDIDDDDISVIELPFDMVSSEEPTTSPAGPSSTANSGSDSNSSQVSDAVEAGASTINSIECRLEPDLPGMVSTTTTGVSDSKSKVRHAPKVLGPVRGPRPSVSSGTDAKPSSTKSTKRRTPLYRMKMLLDLKKVTESNEEADMPHIPTLKEWVRQEKRREKQEKKKAKKIMKREKELKKELEQKEKKAAGVKTNEKRPAWGEVKDKEKIPQQSGSQSKKERGASKDKLKREIEPKDQKVGGKKTKEKQAAAAGETNQKEKVPQCSGRQLKGMTKEQWERDLERKEQKSAGVKPDEKQPKMAWYEVSEIEDPPEQSGPQSKNENGIANIQPKKELEPNLMVIGVKIEPKQPEGSKINEKERAPLQRPLGAHHKRRRSTLINVQEKSPEDYYSRGAARPDSDSDTKSGGEEQRVEHVNTQRRRPLAAHHKRRRSAMENVQQNSPEQYYVRSTLPKNTISVKDEQKMKEQDPRAVQRRSSNQLEKAQEKVKEMDKSQEDHKSPHAEPMQQRKLAWMH